MPEPTIRVAVTPPAAHLEDAVRRGGGALCAAHEADAVVWTDPADPAGLATLLASSPARWVQLPFAGIEGFFAAGVVDDRRTWTCAKGIYGRPTAEGALALMLAAARLIPEHAAARSWGTVNEEASSTLDGATVVIVGAGGIGSALARMLAPLGCRVVAVSRSGRPHPDADETVAFGRLAAVAGDAAWVVLAAPLTDETRGLVDAGLLASMRPDARLVNVARGGLVDTDALVDALRSGTIAGAGLDVTDPEPLPDGHPLWTMPNVIITSHTANTEHFRVPLLAAMVERNVRAFARGEPLDGLVDPAAGY